MSSRADILAAKARIQASRPDRAEVVLVSGPPCSGKTTYVREHACPGDLIVDYDALAVALGSPDSHDHPETLRPYVLQAREAVLERVTRDPKLRRVWLIQSSPTVAQLAGATRSVTMDTSREECHRRADAARRPARWHELIDGWFA